MPYPMPLTRTGLLSYLRERIGVDVDELTDDTLLFSTGVLDSFSMVDLIMFIESETAVKMRPSDVRLDNLDSIQCILAYADAVTGDREAAE